MAAPLADPAPRAGRSTTRAPGRRGRGHARHRHRPGLARGRTIGSRAAPLFEWALILPLAIPAYVVGFAFLGLFEFSGPVQSALRGWLGPGVPPARAALVRRRDPHDDAGLLSRTSTCWRERRSASRARPRSRRRGPSAARALRAFVDVTLPLARPSLAAGVSLAMMEALADFGTVATFGYRTLTEAIYRVWYGMFDRAAATQLASVLLLFAARCWRSSAPRGGARGSPRATGAGRGSAPVVAQGWRRRRGHPRLLRACSPSPSSCRSGSSRLGGAERRDAASRPPSARSSATRCRSPRSPRCCAPASRSHLGYAAPPPPHARRPRPGSRRVHGLRAARRGDRGGRAAAARVARPRGGRRSSVGAGRPAGLLLTGSALGLVFAYVVRFLARQRADRGREPRHDPPRASTMPRGPSGRARAARCGASTCP